MVAVSNPISSFGTQCSQNASRYPQRFGMCPPRKEGGLNPFFRLSRCPSITNGDRLAQEPLPCVKSKHLWAVWGQTTALWTTTVCLNVSLSISDPSHLTSYFLHLFIYFSTDYILIMFFPPLLPFFRVLSTSPSTQLCVLFSLSLKQPNKN